MTDQFAQIVVVSVIDQTLIDPGFVSVNLNIALNHRYVVIFEDVSSVLIYLAML